MARDSLFGETIEWSGRPVGERVSPLGRAVVGASGAIALVTLAFAVVVASALHRPPGGLVVFAGWCAALGMLAYTGPRIWRSKVEYIITDKHVIWRRGPIRRSIERDSVSYALVRWNPALPGVGDLVLVRAVPTGALRRTLNLTLSDVEAPDRLLARVRGVEPSESLGDGERPLAQRLDEGERVLWSGIPMLAPWTVRRALTAGIALVITLAGAQLVREGRHALGLIQRSHALPPWSFAVVVFALASSVLFMAGVACGVAYVAWLRPRRLARATRYLVTNQRVLIRRGNEELSLDRTRIADVIAAPTRRPLGLGPRRDGLHGALVDLFLVLDGPHARAFASSGAFGEGDGDQLVPVISAIEDAETVGALLRPGSL